jgi:putative FmdB family regulatory protein
VPLYEYECQKCHTRTERIEKLNGPHLKACPKCKGKVERMISRTAIQFKGTGWYVTDYAKSGSAGPTGDTSKSEKSEGAPAATATADKSEKSTSDTKSKPKPAAASKGKKSGGDS